MSKSCVSYLSEVNDIEEDLPDGEMADDEDMSDPKEVDEVSRVVTECYGLCFQQPPLPPSADTRCQ